MRNVLIVAASVALFAALCLLLPFNSDSAVAETVQPTTATSASGILPVYKNTNADLESRVEDLFSRMTPAEKLSLLSGTGFTTQPIPRLGVPAMGMVDAGQGVRGGTPGTMGPASAFPSEIGMARTWDVGLVSRIGKAIGEEARNKGEGAQVLLAPCVNIHRSPLGGRNAESFSEDPSLAAQMAVAYIDGVQSAGTIACIKHFACNNEETDRNTVDVHVNERTLREIYLPAFRAGVTQGHAYAAMDSYNKIRGDYATANHYLDTDVLKNDWGFDGVLMSDWGAVHGTADAINGGCDLEMPGNDHMTPPKVQTELTKGSISQSSIDNSVRRILRTIIRAGLLDGPRHPDPAIVNSTEHQQLAYEAATRAIILLKNDHDTLPLDRSRIKSIAVIGPAAVKLQIGALGSPAVPSFYTITPLDGIKKAAGDAVTVNYAAGIVLPGASDVIPADNLSPPDTSPQPPPSQGGATGTSPQPPPSQGGAAGTSPQPPPSQGGGVMAGGGEGHGLLGEYFASDDLTGTPSTRIDPKIQFYRNAKPPDDLVGGVHSVRWSGKLTAPATGQFTITLMSRVACRLVIDDKTVIDEPDSSTNGSHSAKVDLVDGHSYNLRVEILGLDGTVRGRLAWALPGHEDIPAAAQAAAKSDVAVVFVTTGGQEAEGRDRPSMALPGDQDKLIESVVAANKQTIVVLNGGTPCRMEPWLNHVRGLIDMGFPGQEGGHAIASVLFGDVNPSGKLTDTVGARREDYPDFGNFPGTKDVVNYAEGIYVGYRHFDKRGIKPIYPFGYGLSYTSFEYSNLKLTSPSLSPDGTLGVTMDLTNTGKREGAEVVELYVRDTDPKVDRPVRELKGFNKVDLQPGETRPVSFTVTPRDLGYYDVSKKKWRADDGAYAVDIGASSRDIRLSQTFQLLGLYTAKD